MKIKLLLVALALCASMRAGVVSPFEVNVNTTAIAGTSGFLEFVLSASGVPPTVTAHIGPLLLPGGTPAVGPAVNLDNSALFDFNDVPVTWGTSLVFDVALTLGPVTFPLSNGTTFTVGLLDSQGNYLVNSANGGGPVATLDLTNVATWAPSTFDASIGVTALPEPAPFALTGFALIALAGIRRRFGR
jgi:hypothetical protein